MPPPSSDQAAEPSFLDSLQIIKGRDLTDRLRARLIENLRLALAAGRRFDIDISDPGNLESYRTGGDYQLSRLVLDGNPPGVEDVMAALRKICGHVLEDLEKFQQKVESLWLPYNQEPASVLPTCAVSGDLVTAELFECELFRRTRLEEGICR